MKGYLFFLLFTAILAVIIKLAKVYTTTALLSIVIVGIPENLVFTNEGTAEVMVEYEASGFALLRNSLDSKRLEISFKQLSENGGNFQWSHDSDRSKVIDILNATPASVVVRPERIQFTADSLAERSIPVVVPQNLNFSAGYGSDGAMEIVPATIRIIGAAEKIASIDTIMTMPLNQNELSESLNVEIDLDASQLPEGIKLLPNAVQITQQVAKYTEGTLEIPIEIINADVPVQLFPKKIKLFYQVTVKEFDRIRASDFKIICDFSKKNAEDQFMPLEIAESPVGVSDVRLGTKQVQYVIVNK